MLSLFHNGLKKLNREHRIGAVTGLKLGRNPAVTAGQVASFGQVEVDLVEGVLLGHTRYLLFVMGYLFSIEAIACWSIGVLE